MIEAIEYLFSAVLIGIISWVWITIILDVDNLGFIYDAFDWLMKRTVITRFIFKPLFACFYCFAGQLSLWWYLWHYGALKHDILYHIGFICISILTTKILNRKYG